jgi:hypothetical protein
MEPWWLSPMRETFAGRRVLIVAQRPQGFNEHVDHLRSVGADEILLLAVEGNGAGPAPDVPMFLLEPPEGLSMMEMLRHGSDVLADLPADALAALADFDPDRSAVVVTGFLNEAPEVDGRPTLAHRRPEWVALEDKTVIDRFWDDAGIARAPSEVVPLGEAGSAAVRLDEGHGTVWAADARDGFHGGGTGTFWVVDDASRAAALSGLSPMCDSVRVMPFLEGTPCSIHGIVLPDGVAALRPVEMVTLRRGTDLVYAGCATFWDPAAEVRESMRDMVRRAGEQLRAQVDFRGTFTIDGVVTDKGFLPSELNPRFGAGILAIARASGLPMMMVNELILAGVDIGITVTELEDSVLSAADASRGGGTWKPGATPKVAVEERHVTRRDGEFAWADDGDEVFGAVVAGHDFARCLFEPDAVPTGPSVAPLAASFWAFADRELGTGIGPLTTPLA